MRQFRNLVNQVLDEGEPRQWRNGHTGLGVFDARAVFHLDQGFPLLGLKSVPFQNEKGGPVLGELLGFLRGCDNAAQFRALGCQVWDQNANEEPAWLKNANRKGTDDLGRIYGVQWRRMRDTRIVNAQDVYRDGAAWDQFGAKGFRHEMSEGDTLVIHREVDQIAELIHGLKTDPHGRRHIVTAWNPTDLDQMALPPCHMFFQCYVSNDGCLDLKMYQRSADLFLGVPFNIASYATLLIILAKVCGYHPRKLIMDFGDLHLYTNTIELAKVCISRSDKPLPTLGFDYQEGQPLETIEPSQFTLVGYDPHPAMKARMAV